MPIGIAYFGWELDKYGDQESLKKLDVALNNDVQSIWLSFGSRFDRWVAYIRSKDQARPDAQKTKLFILVNNLDEARAAYQLGADVIVAQGVCCDILYVITPLNHPYITLKFYTFHRRKRSWWSRN